LNPTIAGQFVDLRVDQSDFRTDASSVRQPDFVRVQKLQLVLANGSVASQTDFDSFEITSVPDGSVLDTLLGSQIQLYPTMTIYHGHDFNQPFVFTGFAPWAFQRAQCEQLFDFVLQNVWGLTKKPAAAVALRTGLRTASFAPAHRRTGPIVNPTGGLRR